MGHILEQESKSKSKEKTMGRTEGDDPKDLKETSKLNHSKGEEEEKKRRGDRPPSCSSSVRYLQDIRL